MTLAALLLVVPLMAQGPPPHGVAPSGTPVAQPARTVLSQEKGSQGAVPVKAQYGWGYAGKDGTGKGTLALRIDPTAGSLVLELHGMGERLLLLQGDRTQGFHLLIPRREVDTHAPSLVGLPLPFLPTFGTVEALYQLLTEGKGPGVTVTKKDKDGPRKLKYVGKDEQGNEVMVWLDRSRWVPESAGAVPGR